MLYGDPTPTERDLKRNGHKIALILEKHVPEAQQTEAQAIFDRLGVDLDVLSEWRERNTYPDDLEVLHDDAEHLAPTYAALAAEISALLGTHLQQEAAPGQDLDDALAQQESHAALIAAIDVRAGIPTLPDGIDV